MEAKKMMARKSLIGSMHPMTSAVTMWPCADSKAPARKQPSSMETSKNSVTFRVSQWETNQHKVLLKRWQNNTAVMEKWREWTKEISSLKRLEANGVPWAWRIQKLPSPEPGSPCCLCSQHAVSCNKDQSGMIWVTNTAAAQQQESPEPGPGGTGHGDFQTRSCVSKIKQEI